jgi:hypothetical protein
MSLTLTSKAMIIVIKLLLGEQAPILMSSTRLLLASLFRPRTGPPPFGFDRSAPVTR